MGSNSNHNRPDEDDHHDEHEQQDRQHHHSRRRSSREERQRASRHHRKKKKEKVSDFSDDSGGGAAGASGTSGNPSNKSQQLKMHQDGSLSDYSETEALIDTPTATSRRNASPNGNSLSSSKRSKESSSSNARHHSSRRRREEDRRRRRLRAHHHHHHRSASASGQDTFRKYIYSAISATFFFLLFREMGFMGDEGSGGVPLSGFFDAHPLLRGRGVIGNSAYDDDMDPHSKAIVLAGTSSATGTKSQIKVKAHKQMTTTLTKSKVMEAMVGNESIPILVEPRTKKGDDDGSTTTTTTTKIKTIDASYQTKTDRPIIHTFFEWIPIRNRGTQMSDEADIELMNEWKAAWRAAGWEPKVLTLEHAKLHPRYDEYAPKLDEIQMLGIDGMGGNVIYNQLCFLRWLAMAAVGGGFMADYDVFPISKAPEAAKDDAGATDTTAYQVPYGGNFTIYSKIKRSHGAGIPCLMSGREEEWTRMAFAILQNGLEHAKTDSMWSDMLAVIDLRHDHLYAIHDIVAEGQDVLLKHGWSTKDCSVTDGKMAIHFSHEALRKGYIRPGETAEDRPYIIRRFLAKWHIACQEGRMIESEMGDADTDYVQVSHGHYGASSGGGVK